VDEKKVEELLGVPPGKVVDYMGCSATPLITFPEQKGNGRKKGAAE